MYEKRNCGKVNFNNGTFYKRIFSQIGTARADVGAESLYNEENDKTSKERLGEEIENKEKDLSNVKKEEVLEKEKKKIKMLSPLLIRILTKY